jgi:hypothetical protein
MKYQINFDDIKAEMEAIAETMLVKYEIYPSLVAKDGVEVVFHNGVRPEDVIDDLGRLSWMADDFSNMFETFNFELYNILSAASNEVDKMNGS